MGKIDDMRRLREQQFATAEARRSATPRVTAPTAAPKAPAARAAPPAAPPAAEPAAEPAARRAAEPVESEPVMQTKTKTKSKSKSPIGGGKRGGAAEADGKCSVCGKVRPLSNGVISEHQKGFGKACPGSRKKPA